MTWGVVTDMHGNLRALRMGLRELERAGATRLAFLGDYLGRGDNAGCVALVRQHAAVALVGNRDLDWRERVDVAIGEWVLTLPRTACVGGVLFSHGDRALTRHLGTDQAGRDFRDAWRLLDEAGVRVWAFGHSHHARTWRKASASAAAELLGVADTPIDPSSRYFVNVGTTGRPFPGKGGPSVGLVDLDAGVIRHLPLPPRG